MTAIATPNQMEQAIEQLGRIYQSLAALRREVEPINPRNFAVLAEGHLAEIRRLQRQLDEYAGLIAAGQHAVPLWLRVVGGGLDWSAAPTSVLTAVLDALRKGVRSAAELTLRGALTTRPTAELKRSTDFRLLAFAPGSVRVGVRLPAGEGDVSGAVAEALNDYLKVAAWAGSEKAEGDLAEVVPDVARRRLLLNEVGRLVPRERGQIEEIELSGGLLRAVCLPEQISLSRQTRARINSVLDGLPQQGVETHVGDLREIDLDRCSFVLRNAGAGRGAVVQVECLFSEELLETAKEALDKRVEVTGTRTLDEGRRAKPLAVTRLEIIEEPVE
jgi:hypothetical protein